MRNWPATNLLKPLWLEYGGRKKLSEASGLSEGHLSKVNGGKAPLTIDAAEKLADVLGVSLLELGAPEGEAVDARSLTLAHRLAALAAEVERLTNDLAVAQSRLDQIESGRAKPRSTPKPRPRRAAQ